MHRTQVYLDETQVNLAKLYASEDGIGFSEFVRHGLDLAIKEKQVKFKRARKRKHYDPLAGLVGKFGKKGGKRTQVALTHNDIYDL